MYKVYGIPNCDTVKKARKHLEGSSIDFEFVDFKKTPPTSTLVKGWKKSLGDWPINTRGTTYRKLKADFEGATEAQTLKLILDNPSVIKRPVLEKNKKFISIGYKKDEYDSL